FEAGLTKFTHWITGILEWCLKNWKTKLGTLLIAMALFFGSFFLVGLGFIGTDFFPASDKGEFMLQFELEKDASLEKTNFLTQKAEAILKSKPDIERVITTVGQSSDGVMSTAGSRYKSEIHVIMKDTYLESSKVYSAILKRELESELIGAKIQSVNMGLMGAEQAALKLTIIGSDMEDAREFADKAANLLRNVPGATGVKLSSEDGNPEIRVQVDREKMNLLGLNVATVGMT
ncbi:MAG: efflux RND transporter permease subunit, partial [Sphingobacterium sp.]